MPRKIAHFINSYWWLLLVIAISPAVWALFVPGFFGVSDDLHIAWLYEMDRAIKTGQFPPRFVPDLSYGFGYPLFNFVFPLPFYIAEMFHSLGLSLVDSIKAVFFLSVIVSVFGMYYLVRQFTNVQLSLAGALLYIYTPYRAVDLYVRGAYGEIVAFAIFPWVVLSVYKTSAGTSERTKASIYRWIGIGSVAIASLVLSHNIATYMVLPFAGILALVNILFLSKGKTLALIHTAILFGLGLLVSAYFWLPALVESKLMQYDTVFAFTDHFPTIKQLIIPYWGYGASVPGPYDGLSFNIGLANLLILVLAAICLLFLWKRFHKHERLIIIWTLICFTTATIMMNYRSTLIWQTVPLLPYFQFPWRFLLLTTLVTPLGFIALERIPKTSYAGLCLALLAAAMTFTYFKPHDFLGRTDDYYLHRYVPYPTASFDYSQTKEEYLRLPKSTLVRPDRNYELVSANPPAIASVQQKNALSVIINTISPVETVVTYNKYNFPGWYATIDGNKADITDGAPFGQITVAVPSGDHSVAIAFKEPSWRKMLNIVSLLALLLAGTLAVKPSLVIRNKD